MFLVGALPALLAIVVFRKLKEPEQWQAARAAGGKQLGSVRELFSDPRWRRHSIVGMLLAFARVEPGAAAALAARGPGPVRRVLARVRRRRP